MTKEEISKEARRIVGCMCGMAASQGTCTAEVVDEICENYSTFIMCRGHGRNMVFTPITEKTFSWKTEEFE